MIILLTIFCSIGVLLTATILIGEFFAEKNKKSKFSTWWRKHIVGSFEDN